MYHPSQNDIIATDFQILRDELGDVLSQIPPDTQEAVTQALPPIDSLTPWQWAHYLAIANWLQHETVAKDTRLAQVHRYLEAVYHCYQLEAWEAAVQILMLKPAGIQYPLHEQLGIWGSYRELVDLYKPLLGKELADWQGICLNGLGDACIQLGEWSQALTYHQTQYQLGQALSDVTLQLQALNGLGSVYFYQGHYQQAQEVWQRQYRWAQQAQNVAYQILALCHLAYILLNQQKPKAAYQQLQPALKLMEQTEDSRVQSQVITIMSAIAGDLGKYALSNTYAKQQRQLAQSMGDRNRACRALYNLGHNHMMLNQFASAQACLETALQEACDMGIQTLQVMTLHELGILLGLRMRDYTKGYDYLVQALAMAKAMGNLRFIGSITGSLAACLGYLERYEEALNYSTEALAISREMDSAFLEGVALGAIANVHWQSRRYIKGLIYVAQALIIWQPWRASGHIMRQLFLEEIRQKSREWLWFLKKGFLPTDSMLK